MGMSTLPDIYMYICALSISSDKAFRLMPIFFKKPALMALPSTALHSILPEMVYKTVLLKPTATELHKEPTDQRIGRRVKVGTKTPNAHE